jgi:hypothetical protein
MSSRNITFRWRSDSSQLQADFDKVATQTKRVQRALLQLGKTGDAGQIIKSTNATSAAMQKAQGEVKLLRAAFDQLSVAREAALKRGTGVNLSKNIREVTDTPGTGFVSLEKAEKLLVRLQQLAKGYESDIAGWTGELQQFNNQLIATNQLNLQLSSIGGDALRSRAANATQGLGIEAAIQQRLVDLERTRSALIERRAALQQRVFDQLDPSGQARVQQQLLDLREQEGQALARINALQAQRVGVEERLAAVGSKQLASVLEQLRQGQTLAQIKQAGTLPTTGPEVQADMQRFIGLTEQLTAAQQKLAITQQRLARPEGGFGAVSGRIGVAEEFERITTQLGQMDQEIAGFTGAGRLDEINKVAPKLFTQIRRLNEVSQKYTATQQEMQSATGLTARQYNNLAQRSANLARLQQSLTTSVEKGQRALATQGVLRTPNFDEITASLKGFERTLIGAFRGIGRRFQATLQFSLSAGLIFGIQRLLRDFITTAIDVERAFVDIASALEFDIEAPRGTAEFREQLEDIRRDVLDIANEFNVLPTVANEIAFKMVARFSDVDNALIATRAQLLALKVSTIDADEVLRSLTAVAEGFANVVLTDVNSALTLQERLLARETAAVLNLGKALDLATRIQQQFGIDLEDTVEGTARATETFESMGFTMQETMSIIASASRVLPGTGVQIAERIVRAFGSFTSDETRDKLLDLAAASDNLQLSLLDFGKGGKFVLQKIQDQIDKLDPKELVEIQQIIGQRRELEVVAAVLGTADLQKDMQNITDEVGAAEDRFSFLEGTSRELINSISAQFESLATNLTQIGVLTPFKLLLSSANLFLEIVNKLLRGVINLIQALNKIRIPGFGGLGDALTTMLALGLAARALLRTMTAIGVAQAALGIGPLLTTGAAALINPRTNKPFVSAGAKAGGGAVAAGLAIKGIQFLGRSAEAVGKGLVFTLSALRKWAASLTFNITAIRASTAASYKVIAAKVKEAFTSARGGSTTPILTGAQSKALGIAAVVALFVSAAFSMRGSIVQSNESFTNHIDAVNASRKAIELEAEARGASPAETRLDVARGAFEIAQNREDTGGFFGNQLTAGFRALIPKLDETLNNSELLRALLKFQGHDVTGLDTLDQLRARVDLVSKQADRVIGAGGFDRKALIPGSAEQNDILEAMAAEELILASIAEFRDNASKIKGGDAKQIASNLSREGGDILFELSRAADPEEVLEILPRLADWAAAWKALADSQNITLEGIEGSLGGIQRRARALAQKIEIGDTSFGTGERKLKELIAEATQLRADASDPATQEKLDAEILSLRQQYTSTIAARFDQQRSINNAYATEENRLKNNVRSLSAEVRSLTRAGSSREAGRVQLELIEAQRELADFAISTIRTQSQIAQRAANTPEQTIAILRRERSQLIRAALLSFNPAVMEFVAQIIVELSQTILELVKDTETRRLVAEARASGPILSSLNRLKSDLIGLRRKLADVGGSSVAGLELINQINENLANQALELLKAAQSFTLLSAGVNDSMLDLKAQLVNVGKEIALSTQIYEATSAQVGDLKRKQLQLQNQLIALELELRDLNRRIGSDVTNSLEQAQLDLLLIMEKLQAPDLGPLEKARLELERKNAEAAAKRAFFDDRLFQLEFAFETGEIGLSAYIGALEKLLSTVDVSTQQGKEIFLEIQSLIESLADDASDMAFNIPASIRLPTLFEVRRALAADQLGVNYQDNRVQDININVSDEISLQAVLDALDAAYGKAPQRVTPGAAGITTGPF